MLRIQIEYNKYNKLLYECGSLTAISRIKDQLKMEGCDFWLGRRNGGDGEKYVIFVNGNDYHDILLDSLEW